MSPLIKSGPCYPRVCYVWFWLPAAQKMRRKFVIHEYFHRLYSRTDYVHSRASENESGLYLKMVIETIWHKIIEKVPRKIRTKNSEKVGLVIQWSNWSKIKFHDGEFTLNWVCPVVREEQSDWLPYRLKMLSFQGVNV